MNKYISVQFGARRAYAVPAILEQAGLLEVFYTDLCGNVGIGKLLTGIIPDVKQRGAIKRLLKREVPENITNKTVTFPLETFKHFLRQSSGKYKSARGDDILWNTFDDDLGRAMIQRGMGQATHIFSMAGECKPFIKHAHELGLSVVTEFYSMPSRRNIYQEEWRRFPNIEDNPDDRYVEAYNAKQREICSLTDWVIAPSAHVIEDLTRNFGFPSEKCFVVPYAVHESWLELVNEPIEGRVLFVGLAGLGKGIHYLGMASQKINNPRYDFRVVGFASDAIRSFSPCKSLNFAGFVPRTEVKEEFKKADIFVIPSLFEGSAEVTYEALATGIPVITTAATGSVVRDGIEGFIVPERDPDALATRIKQLIENRSLRQKMAIAAKERARDFTWKQYSERLQKVFSQIP